MSDTPRTDRAHAFDDSGEMVTASFARTLERELARAMEKLAESEVRNLRLNRVERELDEARECLREIISQLTLVDSRPSGETWQLTTCDGDEVKRWMMAARVYHTRDAKKMVEDEQ